MNVAIYFQLVTMTKCGLSYPVTASSTASNFLGRIEAATKMSDLHREKSWLYMSLIKRKLIFDWAI